MQNNPESYIAEQRLNPNRAMHGYFYRSPVVFELERDQILTRSWLFAGHVSQLPRAGDYFLFELAGESIIISRDETGEIQAQLNVCRHRGARVCEAKSGNTRTFVCPYHGWVYSLDGALKSAREMPELEKSKFGLLKPQLETFHGLIFVNCDPGAPSFLPELECIDDGISGHNLECAKVADHRTYQVNANWKLALENYLECYHCATAHRAYAKSHTLKAPYQEVASLNEAMMSRSQAATGISTLTLEVQRGFSDADSPGGGVEYSRYALYPGYLTGSEDGQPVAPLMGSYLGFDEGAGDFQMGPLTFMLGYPDHCVVYRFTPRSLTVTDMDVFWLVRADAQGGRDYDISSLTWLWDHTTKEDEYIILRNAAGVSSKFFEPGPLHQEYEMLNRKFVRWYLDRLGDGLSLAQSSGAGT